MIERLVPGRCYRLYGAHKDQLVADHAGRATLEVAIAGRTRLRLAPAL